MELRFGFLIFVVYPDKSLIGILSGAGAVLGFIIGTVPVFYIPFIPVTKSVQGMYLNDIVLYYLKYKVRRSLKVMKEEL